MTLIDKAEAVTLLHEIADDFADPHVRGAAIAVAYIFTERADALPPAKQEHVADSNARGVGVDIEDMARTIYDAMRFDRKDKTPEWVNGGNSHAQVEARAAAARILALIKEART